MTGSISPSEQPDPQEPTNLLGRFIYSSWGAALAKLPPVAWLTRRLAARMMTKRRVIDDGISGREPSIDLASALRGIAYDVVEIMGYAGAMVATYEPGDILPVRALYVDPKLISMQQVDEMVSRVAALAGRTLSLTDPQVARVFIHRSEYKDNLSVKAAQQQRPVISDNLFDLFTPIAPETVRPAIDGIQQSLGIRQVITVPFFIETNAGGDVQREYVGNLFAAKCSEILEADVLVLLAFARQVAAAILSERRRLQAEVVQQLILDIQRGLVDEAQILERIVHGLVDDLGYAGAMVATYELGDSLALRAFYVDPQMVTMERVHELEDEISMRYSFRPLSLTDPGIARVHLNKDEYRENLSFKAAQKLGPVVSNDLFDLFRPIVPDAAQAAMEGIQQALHIRQVIAVPFFIESYIDGHIEQEFVGNLFAATRSQGFSSWEIDILRMFAQQAAAGLKNARLYRQSEARRLTAEILGKMAFSATASLHAFRNHVGFVRMSLQMLTPARLEEIAKDEQARLDLFNQLLPPLFDRLDKLADLLQSLHEPFRQVADMPVDVNICVHYALNRLDISPAWVQLNLADNLPKVHTSQEMLSEALRVVIKNALEAVEERSAEQLVAMMESGSGPLLQIASRQAGNGIEVIVRDQGIGVPPEKLSQLFQLGQTTKQVGLGFGLFWTKDYVEGLGGSIKLESVWQQGTAVHLLLPGIIEDNPVV